MVRRPATGALLDRVGMHRVTAPGSARGAVDFIPLGGYYFNVADFFIVGATLVFLLAVVHRRIARNSIAPASAGKKPAAAVLAASR